METRAERRVPPVTFAKVFTSPRGRWRVFVEGFERREDESTFAPRMNETASIQCVPMSPTARSLPPSLASKRQL